MASRILLYAAGLLAAACIACVPAMLPPPLQPAGVPLVGCPVLDNIAILPDQYVGKDDPGNFVPPGNLSSAPNDMSALIKAAFDRAPAFFQSQICGLNGIYIEPNGGSWGLRNRVGNRYIALSTDLWSQSGRVQYRQAQGGQQERHQALRLSDYKTGVVQGLVGWTGPSFTPMPNDSSHDPEMTILAVMAHEFGHVLFYDKFVSTWGTTPTYDATGLCGVNFFDQSWATSTIPLEPVYWRAFDDVVAWHKSDDVQIWDFRTYTNGNTLGQFYDGKGATAGKPSATARWPSLLAGFAPDHDFIETFELFVLINSKTPLKSLEINIPGYGTSDIVKTCRSRETLWKQKLTCMQTAFCPTCNVCPQ